MRSTRNQPFCWQEKKVFRLLRKQFSGSELVKLRCLYGVITEIDSDFNSQDIKYYTKTIHTYSGLSKEWIPTGLKILQNLKVLTIIEEKENGKFRGKRIHFTPENIEEVPVKTVPGKPGNGKPLNGKNDTSEDILLVEDSHISEDIHCKDKNTHPPKKTIKKPNKNKYLDFVLLTTAEHDSLIQKYGKDVTDEYIERVNNYVGSNGRRYKNHYFTILQWLKKDNVKKLPPKKHCPDCKTEVNAGGWCKKCGVYVVGVKNV